MNANLPCEDWDRLESIAGSFTMRKDALEEPEIHVKRVRKPNGRRVVEQKVITHTSSLMDHVRDGGIVVDELCGADVIEFDGTGSPLPRIVCRLLYAPSRTCSRASCRRPRRSSSRFALVLGLEPTSRFGVLSG